MSFYRRIKYFLVHSLKLTNKEAQKIIEEGKVSIDGAIVFENCQLNDVSEIKVNNKIVRKKREFVYLLFNKPAGFESTLKRNIVGSLYPFFKDFEGLSIAGRLDKASEGLLLLSNDGKWVENLCNPKFEKEKEYIVTLDKTVTDEFIEHFKSGVPIDKIVTKNCVCEKINKNTIKVVLKEGKNRQIRKMCKVLGYEVLNLKRTRIAGFLLTDLQPGSYLVTKI